MLAYPSADGTKGGGARPRTAARGRGHRPGDAELDLVPRLVDERVEAGARREGQGRESKNRERAPK